MGLMAVHRLCDPCERAGQQSPAACEHAASSHRGLPFPLPGPSPYAEHVGPRQKRSFLDKRPSGTAASVRQPGPAAKQAPGLVGRDELLCERWQSPAGRSFQSSGPAAPSSSSNVPYPRIGSRLRHQWGWD
ncbi:MAG TPA: hypothetical protein PKV33_03730 [Methanothrix sp.]|nr:hypothetical protein [Methanothrix sp.]